MTEPWLPILIGNQTALHQEITEVQCSAVHHNAVKCSAVHYSSVQCSEQCHSALYHCALQYSTV